MGKAGYSHMFLTFTNCTTKISLPSKCHVIARPGDLLFSYRPDQPCMKYPRLDLGKLKKKWGVLALVLATPMALLA